MLPVHAQEGSISVSAQAAVVINADNGQVLYAKMQRISRQWQAPQNYDGALTLEGCKRE